MAMVGAAAGSGGSGGDGRPPAPKRSKSSSKSFGRPGKCPACKGDRSKLCYDDTCAFRPIFNAMQPESNVEKDLIYRQFKAYWGADHFKLSSLLLAFVAIDERVAVLRALSGEYRRAGNNAMPIKDMQEIVHNLMKPTPNEYDGSRFAYFWDQLETVTTRLQEELREREHQKKLAAERKAAEEAEKKRAAEQKLKERKERDEKMFNTDRWIDELKRRRQLAFDEAEKKKLEDAKKGPPSP